MSKRHFCRVKAHPSQGLLAGMKLGGVAAVGGSLLGYAGAAAIQEQVSQVGKVPPGDRDLPSSNPPATTSTRTTRPSLRSTSPHHERTRRPRQRLEGELWTEEEGRRGVDGEVCSHLVVGSFKRRGVGVLCKCAGSGGRGAEEREGLGPSLAAGGMKIGTRGKMMGAAGERLEDRIILGGESGQSTCRARRREPRRCDRLKMCLSHKHNLLYLICLFSFYICAT